MYDGALNMRRRWKKKGREDKAELFSFLMWNDQYVAERMNRDRVVAKKAGVLLTRVRGWCPAFSIFPQVPFIEGSRTFEQSYSCSAIVGPWRSAP